jgi:hypothetical protein
MHSKSDHRRPGIFPGRRFALDAAVACLAVAGGAALPATAAADPGADQTVVSATVFPGSEGSSSSVQVPLSTLNTCGNYTGPASVTMQSAGGTQPPQAISEPAWTLGTILTCGLQVPEAFDFGQYPGSAGALPTIYVDGGEDQTTYVRPPLSATDANAADNVTQQGDPISLIVYENQPPLVVTATQSPVASSQGTTEQVALGATVTTADGTAVPSSALTFSWAVDTSQPLTGPAPVATVDAGVTPVTVQVYDQSAGTGGTYTFDITYNPQPGQSSNDPGPGAGNHPKGPSTGKTKLNGGGGLDHAGTNPGTGTTRARQHSTRPSHTSTPPTPAKQASSPATAASSTVPPALPPTTQTATVTTPAPATTPGLTVVTTQTLHSPRRRTHAPKRRSVARSGASKRVVAGRLVADVQALPAGTSPLVHPIAASAVAPSLVHAANDGTSAPTWVYAGLAVLALLGGGAVYERRGRRGRTLHR